MNAEEVRAARQKFWNRLNASNRFGIDIRTDAVRKAVQRNIDGIHVVVQDFDRITFAAHDLNGDQTTVKRRIIAATDDLLLSARLEEDQPLSIRPLASLDRLLIRGTWPPATEAVQEWTPETTFAAVYGETTIEFPIAGEHTSATARAETELLLRKLVQILERRGH